MREAMTRKFDLCVFEVYLNQVRPPGWVKTIHRVAARVEILMESFRINGFAVLRIAGQESSGRGVVVSGAEIVEG
jgi:hypothetical protein